MKIIGMKDIEIKQGCLSIDINKDRDLAIYLAFSTTNQGNDEYNTVLNSLPKIRGLKRGRNRVAFTFDIVNGIHKLGYSIKKNE